MKINDNELDKVNGGYVTYSPETDTYRVYDNDSGKLGPSYPSPGIGEPGIIEPAINDPALPQNPVEPLPVDLGGIVGEVR